MSQETAPDIVVKYIGSRKCPCMWELTQPVRVTLSDGFDLVVPAGYTTNFASVPRVLWALFPPFGVSVCIASLVHDYLYDTRPDPNDKAYRQKADQEFLHLLQKYNEAGEVGNKLMWAAVATFGRKQFRNE